MALIRLMEEVIPLYLADFFDIFSSDIPSSPRGSWIGPAVDLHGEAIGDGSQAFR